MSRRRGKQAGLIGCLLGLAVAGCGPTPPQAPPPQAMKLDAATGGISTACGESYQVIAFPGDHRADLATLNTNALVKVSKLASVYARNPDWYYQGETIRQIVGQSVTMLQQCGLEQAAAALERATGKH